MIVQILSTNPCIVRQTAILSLSNLRPALPVSGEAAGTKNLCCRHSLISQQSPSSLVQERAEGNELKDMIHLS